MASCRKKEEAMMAHGKDRTNEDPVELLERGLVTGRKRDGEFLRLVGLADL